MTDAPEHLAQALAPLGVIAGSCILFGGWAEELQGLRPPGSHGDVDLLLPAPSFAPLERAMATNAALREIRAKRFAHKRAWAGADGLVLEFLLVTREAAGPVTRFWGDRQFHWLEPLGDRAIHLAEVDLAVASSDNLIRYRRLHCSLEPWRWRDPASLVA